MTNEELVEVIQQGINVQDNLTTLYEQNKGFIYKLVKPFMEYAEPDDLLQEAYLGFHDAVFKYIPGDALFITYYPYRVRRSCILFLENTSNTKRIPVTMQENIRKYQNFILQYKNEHGKEPSEAVICAGLDMSQKRLDRIKQTIHEMNCISIHDAIPGTEELAIEDIIADETNIEEQIQEKQMHEYTRQVLDDAIQELTPSQAEVITSRYWNNDTQGQIAERLNVSIARVSQIEHYALRKMETMQRLQELMDEVFGYDSHMAYGISRKYALDNHTSSTEKLALRRIECEEKIRKTNARVNLALDYIVKGR